MKLKLLFFAAATLFAPLLPAAEPTPLSPSRNLALIEKILARSPPTDRTVRLGDMDFPRAALVAHRDKLAGKKPDSAFDGNVTLWTGGVVPYAFEADVTPEHRRAMVDGMRDWATFAALTFVERTNQTNYVRILNSPNGGGYSAVGMIGGAQDLGIGPGSWNRGTICHELGHALGLVHEHQRSDRDNFVAAFPENTLLGLEGNFVTLPNSLNNGPYDFLSCMHYERSAFSSEPGVLDTLAPLPGYEQFANVMGQYFTRVLSREDRVRLAAAYGAGPMQSPVVTNTEDSGPGSLRAAITYATDHPGTTISFNLPTTDPNFDHVRGDWTIRPTDVLPRLPVGTVLDAATQPGAGQLPRIVLNGEHASADDTFADGLVLTESAVTVRGLRIVRFPFNGLLLHTFATATAHNNAIQGCVIGLDSAGNPAPNGFGGVQLSAGANHNLIGGPTAADRCVISGNAFRGVVMFGVGTSANTLAGSYLGTDETGTSARPNQYEGVALFDGASGNYIGTDVAGGGNVISGNVFAGVVIAGAESNLLVGNAIGTNAARTAALPNQAEGVAIFGGAQFNYVGDPRDELYPDRPAAGNLISGNLGAGVTVSQSGTYYTVIFGNLIGTNANGSAALPNGGSGIDVFGGATETRIGGGFPGGRNVVSGNAQDGVRVSGAGTNSTLIVGNYIGANALGSAALANGGHGVAIFNGAGTEFAATTVGSSLASRSSNVIAGNAGDGVNVSGGSYVKVRGNFIGSSADGLSAVPNGFAGAAVFGGATLELGFTSMPGLENVPYGNVIRGAGTHRGVVASGPGTVLRAERNLLVRHLAGFEFFGGARGSVLRNDVRQSTDSGIQLFDGGTQVWLQQNLFSGSGRVPINLAGGTEDFVGRTANDAGDADSGPNGLLNYPVLASATQLATGTRVVGSYAGPAGQQLQLDFYELAAPSEDVLSWLGQTNLKTDGGGAGVFDVTFAPIARAGRRVAATATLLPSLATSELSLARVVTSLDSDGDGLPDDYELAHGFDPFQPTDASEDGDGDGQSNLAEHLAGTDPRDPNSLLQAFLVGLGQLTFPAASGRSYTVEKSEDLAVGEWLTLLPSVIGEGAPLTLLLDPFSGFEEPRPRRFYRVRLLP